MTSTVKAPAIDPEEFRRLGHELVDLVTNYLAGIRARPVFQPMRPDERRALMDGALGDEGLAPAAIVERFRATVLPHAMGNGHPRFFGWSTRHPRPSVCWPTSWPPP